MRLQLPKIDRFAVLVALTTTLLIPVSVRAQTGSISGTVTNAQTGAPIVGIEVAAFNPDVSAEPEFGPEALLCSESSGCLRTDLVSTDRTEEPLIRPIVPQR